MQSIFEGCQNIKSLPDINNWNIKNVKSMKYIFKNCKKLECIPDISTWFDLIKKDMHSIIDGCDNLKSNNQDQVYWNKWEGKNIVNDIIKNKKTPDKIIIEKLRQEVKRLIGGAKLVYNYLCDKWDTQYEENNYVKEILSRLADKIYDKIK